MAEIKELTRLMDKPEQSFKDLLAKLAVGLKGIKFEELVRYKGDTEVRKLVDECAELLANFRHYL